MAEEDNFFDGALDASNVSPCWERSTPSCYLWAKDLRHLLEDFDGYTLFRDFLSLSNSQNELEFWYACNGLKLLQRSKERERIVKVAKELCKDFIHAQGEKRLECISSAVRAEIQDRLAQHNVDENVFDGVQQEVYANLNVKHAEFIVSDTYIAYLQTVQPSGDEAEAATYFVTGVARNSSRSSTNEEDDLSSSSFLPTVQEVDDEVDLAISDETPTSTTLLHRSQGVSDGCTLATISRVDRCEARTTTSNDYCDSIPLDVSFATPLCIATSKTSCDDKTTARRKQHPSTPASSSKRNIANAIHQRDNDFSSSSRCSNSWLRANLHNITPSDSDRKKNDSKLTPKLLIETYEHRNRSTAATHVAQFGVPPHPYYTQTSQRPYGPRSTTSAQDSGFESVPSDAVTESSVSGGNFRHKERHRMKNTKQDVVPRTQRSIHSKPPNMMNEKFRSQALEELEKLCEQNNIAEKLHMTLQTLANPNDANSSRAALKNFNQFKERQPPENDCRSILDDHFIRIGWQEDTPPSRSSGSKSLDRLNCNKIMTASYPETFPSTSQQQLTSYQQSLMDRHPPPDQSFGVHFTQSACLPQHDAHFSASNTLHLHSKTFKDAHLSADVEKQWWSASTRPNIVPFGFPDANDMISSSGSTNGCSCSKFFGQNYASSGDAYATMPKSASSSDKMETGKTNIANGGGRLQQQTKKNNFFSKIKSNLKKKFTTSGDRHATADADLQLQSAATKSQLAFGEEFIIIVYVLPNEPTPFRTKFCGSKITFKQFKGLLTKRQNNFKYFFKSRSSEDGSEFWQELFNDTDEVPFLEYGKINARIDASE